MVKQKVKVTNPSGLHLRPAGNLCKEALKFRSKIDVVYGKTTANAKSVLSVLGAAIKCGSEVEFICVGDDEVEALAAMIALAEDGFGEE